MQISAHRTIGAAQRGDSRDFWRASACFSRLRFRANACSFISTNSLRGTRAMNYARYCCAGSAALVIAAASTVVFTALPSMAAELSIVSGSATAGLLSELGPQFEQRTGHKLVFYKGVGTTAGVKQRIESGEP